MPHFYVSRTTTVRVAGGCSPCAPIPVCCVLAHMTQTADFPTSFAVLSPQERVDAWLSAFEMALATRDIVRATGMFAVDSFWRDLVSFTWNLKTLEGREAIGQMLETRLAGTDPSGFRT